MQWRALGAALVALTLAACASTAPLAPAPPAFPPPEVQPTEPPPAPPAAPEESAVPLSALRGWASEDHAAAFEAFRQGCGAARDPETAPICRAARAKGPLDADEARRFFETQFRAERATAAGVLTAYFAPDYPARHIPDELFSAPIRGKPDDLKAVDAGTFDPAQAGRPGAGQTGLDGALAPYPDRVAIEAAPVDRPLGWMRPEDLFFLQIQGSGVLTFEDGQRLKALYAGNNGRPFVGIANPMRDKGLLAREDTSAETIRAWLSDHRGPEADAIMDLNPRYVFFRLAPDDGRQPVGAANVPLPPGRALAVDPAFHQMGELYWLDAEAPILTGAFPTYRRLALALDTGGAIKGDVRADLYLGLGAAAGVEACRVRHTLRLYRLVPAPSAP